MCFAACSAGLDEDETMSREERAQNFETLCESFNIEDKEQDEIYD